MHAEIVDFIIEVVQNAVEAGSKRIFLEIRETGREFAFEVVDDGTGMNAAQLERAVDPFVSDGRKHPERRVGLGLPFLKHAAEQAGGRFAIRSAQGTGTTVSAVFDLTQIDTPPIGDLNTGLAAVFTVPGEFELELHRIKETDGIRNEYRVAGSELLAAVGGCGEPGAAVLIRRYLESQEEYNGETDSG